MKGVAIVALFLLLQAAPPAPREAADNRSKSSDTHQDKSAPDKTQPNPPVVAQPQPAEKGQKPSQKLAGEDEDKPIVVRVVPVDVHKDRADYIYIGASLLIALATLILAGIAWTQAKSARASAEAAKANAQAVSVQTETIRDTAERQMRAYVCVDSACVKFPQPNVPEAQVHFRNSGQTPAYDFRGWIHTWFGEYPLNEVLPPAPSDLRKGTEVLAPGRKSIFVAPQKPPLPTEWLQILGTQKFTLYVYGEVYYRDAFGKERCTKYRLIYGGAEGVRKVPGKEEWLLKPDSEGNEAT